MKIKKIFFVLALTLFLVLICGNLKVSATASFTKGEELVNQNIINGVNYKKFTATSTKDNDDTIANQIVNVTTIKPNTVHFVTWTVPGLDRTVGTNILNIIKNYESIYPNKMVIAAINGDYFNINGDYQMISAAVAEGKVMKETTEGRFYSMGIKDDGTYYLTGKGEAIDVSDSYYLNIYDSSRTNIIKTIEIENINSAPESSTSFYFKHQPVEIEDAEVYSINATARTKFSNVYYYKGSVTGVVDNTSVEYESIVTKDLEVAKLLDSKPIVELYKKPAGVLEDYDCVMGMPSQFLKDGNVLSYDEIGDQGEAYTGIRNPRTCLGFKSDGTVVFMTIDGRQSPTMDGVTLRECGYALINEGCSQGFNLDGGGSTTMAVLLNGKMTVVNSPSDGNMRSDSDYLLAVVDKTDMNYTTSLEEEDDNHVTLKGSVDIECLNGFEYLSSEIYINGRATGESADSFVINNLLTNQTYNICTYLTYKVGAATYTRPFTSYDCHISGNSHEYVEPSNLQVEFVKTDSGFNTVITIDDPSNVVTNVEVLCNNMKCIVLKDLSSYFVKTIVSTDKDYEFIVSYSVRESIESYDVIESNVYEYSYKASDEPIDDEPVDDEPIIDNKTSSGCSFGMSYIGIFMLIGISFIIIRRKH